MPPSDRINDPWHQLTLEQQKELAAYYIRARDLLDKDGRDLNVMLRVDDIFIWVLPTDLSDEDMEALQDKWSEMVPGHRLVIVANTVFLPRMEILYSAQPRVLEPPRAT